MVDGVGFLITLGKVLGEKVKVVGDSNLLFAFMLRKYRPSKL